MAQLYKNLATSTLTASLLTGATALALPVGHGARFPGTGGAGSDYFYVFLQDSTTWEIVKVVTRATDNFTVIERGAQGSTANPGTFLTGTVVSLRMSAADVEAIVNHMANATTAHAASAISNTPAGNLAATTVQAALDELQTDVDTRATSASVAAGLAAHTAATDPHPTYTTAAELATGLATKQEADATLAGLAALTIAVNEVPVGSGTDAFGKLTVGTAIGNLPVLGTESATETLAGLLEIATAAEAVAYASGKAIDGAKLVQAFKSANQSLAASGYQRLPGGLIIQWGFAADPGNAVTTVTFPIAFPTLCAVVDVMLRTSEAPTNFGAVNLAEPSLTGVTYDTQIGNVNKFASNWVAIGY